MAKKTKTSKAKKTTTAKVGTVTKAKTSTKAKPKSKDKAVKAKLDTKNTKDTVKQTVKSTREIKYKYPAGMDDTLKRKSWRQKTRNKLRSLELAVAKADTKKALADTKKALQAYREEVLLVP